MTHAAHQPTTAIVTGAAGGIGAAIAMRLASDGLAVGLIDRDGRGHDEDPGDTETRSRQGD